MKKRFAKFLSVFFITFSLVFSGCSMGLGGFSPEIPDNLQGALENSDEMLNLQNNVTEYKDKDGKTTYNTFSDAYIFIDPGHEAKFNDHFTGEEMKFSELVDRQITLLSEQLVNAIYNTYGTHTTDSSTYVFAEKYNETSGEYEADITSNSISFFDSSLEVTQNQFDLNNPRILQAIAENENNSDIYKTSTITLTDGTNEKDYDVNSYLFNFSNAINGGLEIKEENVEISGEEPKTYDKVYVFGTNAVASSKWSFVDRYTESNALKLDLKHKIAGALAGVETPSKFTQSEYDSILEKIDHIGFTATDVKNVATRILADTIGKDNVTRDNDYKDDIVSVFGGFNINTETTAQKAQIDNVFITANCDWRYYKAYEVVINHLVEQAMKITATYTPDGGVETTETLYPSLPRVQIIVVDSGMLMDASDEDIDDVYDEDGNIDTDNIEIPDGEQTELTEKLSTAVNIVGIMFLPKDITGTRTMARKENGEYVKNEDGSNATKTFDVNGFILSNIEVSLLTEEQNTAKIEANYTVKTKTETITKTGSIMDVGYEKPTTEDDNFSYSTELTELSGMEILGGEEEVVGKYRILGYNGITINEADNGVYDGDTKVAELTKSELDEYSVYSLGTNMYNYITIADVNGTGGTTMAGYRLDLSNFAGENYVLADFTILEVNENEENRQVNLNILFLMLEYM